MSLSAQVFTQQGSKLTGSDAYFPSSQGSSVALSADGNTALVGGEGDSGSTGAAWVYTRDYLGNWTQQGPKLVGSGAVGESYQGTSVALSYDGNTALIGGPGDNSYTGAAWVFTRDANGNWRQQGAKLLASGSVPYIWQGDSVALSADGSTALIGAPAYNNNNGAGWVFTRNTNGIWSQQGGTLVGSGAVGASAQGSAVALSSDGNTALVGGPFDDPNSYNWGIGAVWVFTRNSSGIWTQQGAKLVGSGVADGPYRAQQGYSVALSSDGNTALVGGPGDNDEAGAVWVFTRNNGGQWSQQGSKLVGSRAITYPGYFVTQGWSVALSGDGNTALEGGPGDNNIGAVWVFTRDRSSHWSQAGNKLVGTGAITSAGEPGFQGWSVALSRDAKTAMEGGRGDNGNTGAVWAFVRALSEPLQFVPVKPCRVADTRKPEGPFGGPILAAATTRSFDIPAGACGIPSNAEAYSLSAAVVPEGALYLTIWPAGQSQPFVSSLNSDGRVKDNASIAAAGAGGLINVYASNSTHLILDIDGYFTSGGSSALAFYPVMPCRIADTRKPNGPLGGPFIAGDTMRSFPILSSSCSIPSSAKAYSLNFAAVPHDPLDYLTAWPTGETQPLISTLNAQTGAVTANAAIVAAGTGGDISVYATNDTDLVIDTNGYFAPPGSGGLSLYTQTPCRVLDTRTSSGEFTGTLTSSVSGSTCGAFASAAGAFVLNATVIPAYSLGYLTLWPEGETQPLVATLNAIDGAVTSNLAVVPTTNGSINAYATNSTQLILDMSGFFAP